MQERTQKRLLPAAKAAGRRAAELQPGSAAAHCLLAQALHQLPELPAAINALRASIEAAEARRNHYYLCKSAFILSFLLLSEGSPSGSADLRPMLMMMLTKGSNALRVLKRYGPRTWGSALGLMRDLVHSEAAKVAGLLPPDVEAEWAALGDVWASASLGDQCSGCGKHSIGLRLCAACHSVSYCSPACQRSHWKQHKPNCKVAQKEMRGRGQS